MLTTEFEVFADAWTAAWELCGKTPTPSAIDLAFEALKPYDLAAVTNALTRHVTDPDVGQFPPKPADVIRHLDGTNASKALRAWTRTLATIKHVGPWQSVVFDDPIIHAVIADMGGWIALTSITDGDVPFRAHEFEKRYQGYLAAGLRDYPRQLAGLVERDRREAGQPIPRPVLIGDGDAARRVLAAGSPAPRLKVTPLEKALAENKTLTRSGA